MKRFKVVLLIVLSVVVAKAQITQTIRGQVVDAVSQRGLPGASVILIDSLHFQGS